MGNSKQPSPSPGSPGYRGPKQFRPTPPPAPPPLRYIGVHGPLTKADKDDIRRRWSDFNRGIMPPDPLFECPPTREIREGDCGPAQPPSPKAPPMVWYYRGRRLSASESPPSNGSRYRLARRGPYWRVEEWRRPWWVFGARRWLPF